MVKINRLVVEENQISLVWAGLNPRVSRALGETALLGRALCFGSLDVALKWVEDELLQRADHLTHLLATAHPTLTKIHHRAELASAFSVATSPAARLPTSRLIKYSTRRVLSPGETVYDSRRVKDDTLYVLFVGEVLLEARERRTVFPGSLFNYKHALRIDDSPSLACEGVEARALKDHATALTHAVVLCISVEGFTEMQRAEPPLAMKLLLAVIRQVEQKDPGRSRLIPCKEDVRVALPARLPLHQCAVGSNSKEGAAVYKVCLTPFQIARYGEVFDLIDCDHSGEITLDEVEAYMRSIGRSTTADELISLFSSAGRGEDVAVTREGFLDFLRANILADIDANLALALQEAHAEKCDAFGLISPAAAVEALGKGGFEVLDLERVYELLARVDEDASGSLDLPEFLVAAGMLVRHQREMWALEKAFAQLASCAGEAIGDELRASHLANVLGVPMDTAEDIVLIADLDRFAEGDTFIKPSKRSSQKVSQSPSHEPTIDIIELYRLISGWD